MRVHAQVGHEHDWRKVFRASPQVSIDGMEVRDVVEADDVEGYAILIAVDGAGNPVRGATGFQTVRVTGKVVIDGKPKLATTQAAGI